MVETIFKIAAMQMMTSLIILILLKNYVKNDEKMFFSKINLVTARKRFSRSFFNFSNSRWHKN